MNVELVNCVWMENDVGSGTGIVQRHYDIAMNRTNKNFCPQGINILTEVRKTINNSCRYELRVLSKHNRKDGKETGRQNGKNNDPRIILWLNVGKRGLWI